MKNKLLLIGVPIVIGSIATAAVATSIINSKSTTNKNVSYEMSNKPLEVIRSADGKISTKLEVANVNNEDLKRPFGELKKEESFEPVDFLNGVQVAHGSAEAELPSAKHFKVPAVRYYNNYFSILVNHHGIEKYGEDNLVKVFKKVIDNFPYNVTPLTVGEIDFMFSTPTSIMSAKGGVSGNTTTGRIAMSVADNMKVSEMQDAVYYILQHELQHVNSRSNNIYDKAYGNTMLEPTAKQMIDKPYQFQYAEMTQRAETLKKLELNIIKQKANYATFDNMDLSYIPDLKGREDLMGLSGNFASEVTHLYEKPVETVVEDILEQTLPVNEFTKRKFGESIGGVLGSIAYRMSHGVSLANNPKRDEAVRNIYRNDYIENGFQIMGTGVYGGPKDFGINKTRAFFESNKALDEMGIKLVDSKGSTVPLQSLETRMFARKTVLSPKAVEFKAYLNSFILDQTNIKDETYHFEYKDGIPDDKKIYQIHDVVFGGDVAKTWRPSAYELKTLSHEELVAWTPHSEVLSEDALKFAAPMTLKVTAGDKSANIQFEREIK